MNCTAHSYREPYTPSPLQYAERYFNVLAISRVSANEIKCHRHSYLRTCPTSFCFVSTIRIAASQFSGGIYICWYMLVLAQFHLCELRYPRPGRLVNWHASQFLTHTNTPLQLWFTSFYTADTHTHTQNDVCK